MIDYNAIQKEIENLMGKTLHGHGIDHILRVKNMSLEFCKSLNANSEIVTLTALLHDVDDYKIFGENSGLLKNAETILKNNNVENKISDIVLDNINNMGFSKRLAGIMPKNIEGMIVSDADMCDAIGATGIVRTIEYNNSKGRVFWDSSRFPIINPNAEQYKKNNNPTTDHFFEKLFKLKNLMLTKPGKKEATKRHEVMVLFLQQFFYENSAPDWIKFMDEFLTKQK